MQKKSLSDIKEPELWELSESNDIIITKEGSNEQRVLLNYETYKAIKEKLAKKAYSKDDRHSADTFDVNPFLQDFIDILDKNDFKDITNDEHYFENYVRNLKSGE